MGKKLKQTEKEITRAIRGLLSSLGVWHYKQLGTLGMPPGLPDIIGIWEGRYLGIEVKTERGIVSERQQVFIDSINRAGGIAFVCRSVDECIEKLGIKDRFLM